MSNPAPYYVTNFWGGGNTQGSLNLPMYRKKRSIFFCMRQAIFFKKVLELRAGLKTYLTPPTLNFTRGLWTPPTGGLLMSSQLKQCELNRSFNHWFKKKQFYGCRWSSELFNTNAKCWHHKCVNVRKMTSFVRRNAHT